VKVCADSIIFGLQNVGGISTYWLQLLQGLQRHPDVDPSIRLGRTSRNTDALAHVGSENIISYDWLPTAAARYLPISSGRSDILHSSYYRLPHTFDHARLVTTVYDFIYERYVTGAAQTVHTAQKSFAIGRADVILCISHSTRADLLERYPAIDPKRAIVTHLSYDRDTFHPISPELVDHALERTALFVGARNGYKRFDLAIAAIEQLCDVQLAIVGSPLSAEEHDLLEAHLPGRWRALGRLHNDALRIAYASCLALIYPSDYEGFGLPLLEAMACGAPVVTNRGSSLGEVGGEAPVYATEQAGSAYAQALSTLSSPEARAATVMRGFARCATFDWQRTIDETVAAYRLIA
jgi:mannosyltransferase